MNMPAPAAEHGERSLRARVLDAELSGDKRAADLLIAEDPDGFLAGIIKSRAAAKAELAVPGRSGAAERFLALTAELPHAAQAIIGERNRVARLAKHADAQTERSNGFVAAIREHFEAVMAAGTEPTPWDLALWATRGITPDGYWPWPPPPPKVKTPPPPPKAKTPPPPPPPPVRLVPDPAPEMAGPSTFEADVYPDGRGALRCAKSGKVCFDSEESAKRARVKRKQIAAAARVESRERSVRAYRCPDCDLYHNTSIA